MAVLTNWVRLLQVMLLLFLALPVHAGDPVTLIAAGDLNVAHWLTGIIEQKGRAYPFRHLKKSLADADIIFANLEAPFTDQETSVEKSFVFKADPDHADALPEWGVNLVSLANNHIMDYGPEGLVETIEVLNKNKVHHAGAGSNYQLAKKPALFEIKNTRIALLAYSMTLPKAFWANDSTSGTAYPYPVDMRRSIGDARNNAEIVLVSFHWGEELATAPKEYQVKMAHLAVDAGADAVFGHHPHVLQGVEVYKNRVIAYSLGNFVFASYSTKALDSALLKMNFEDGQIGSAQVLPINVNNAEVNFSPRLYKDTKKAEVLEMLNQLSLELNGGLAIIDRDGNIKIN